MLRELHTIQFRNIMQLTSGRAKAIVGSSNHGETILPAKQHILIVEDEKLHRITLGDSLSQAGYVVTAVEDGLTGLKAAENHDFFVALVDLNLPCIDGIVFLKKLKKISPDTTVIIMTSYGSVESAVSAIKAGAYDYIAKPFLTEELLLTLEKVQQVNKLKQENVSLRKLLEERTSLERIVGRSPQIKKVFQLIETVATGDYNVLITGETGTGKELVAQAIHSLSARKARPFIPLNCAVLPDSLLESELFGYEKGAFTGAMKLKKGRFEQASSGTLFLDDIDDMPLSAQVKLLRVLQERQIERLGGNEPVKIDVRLITATKIDLATLVQKSKFREDLFYRLNVVPIPLPSLRERDGDISLLISHFIEKFCKKTGRPVLKIEPETMKTLNSYKWPGNVRELENTVERLVALSGGPLLDSSSLPITFYPDTPTRPCEPITETTKQSLDSVVKLAEAEHIRRVLAHTGGKKTEAARILQISRKTLWEKIKQYKLE